MWNIAFDDYCRVVGLLS